MMTKYQKKVKGTIALNLVIILGTIVSLSAITLLTSTYIYSNSTKQFISYSNIQVSHKSCLDEILLNIANNRQYPETEEYTSPEYTCSISYINQGENIVLVVFTTSSTTNQDQLSSSYRIDYSEAKLDISKV